MVGLSQPNFEHEIQTDEYYNFSRKKLFESVNKLKYKVITTENTGKLSRDKYFDVLTRSKFCISPFGYGEVNIREIECLLAGTIIIKPNISKVSTSPNIFTSDYCLQCKDDFSDIENVINLNIIDYNHRAEIFIKNQREIFNTYGCDENIVKYIKTHI